MIKQKIDIQGYWTIIVVYNAPLPYEDTGFTFTDFAKKKSIVGISSSSTKEEFINTVVHEAKHVQSHICRYYDVMETSEEAAYLIGYIVQRMYRCFKEGSN